MDEGQRGEPGKIRAVLELIGDYPEAVTYDFRARFGLSPSAPFKGAVTWDEMWDLISALMNDPSSTLCAAANGWDYPISREAITLADLYDLTLSANTSKADRPKIKPHPRPWGDQEANKSSRPTVSQEVIRAALANRGHKGATD